MGESAKILNPDQNLGRFVAMQFPEKGGQRLIF